MFSSVILHQIFQIVSIGSLTSGNLCNIQLHLVEGLQDKIELKSNITKELFIDADKYYQVICITDEKVRSRNFISLVRSNQTNQDSNDIRFNKKFQIANQTISEKNLTFMRGDLIVNSNNFKNDLKYEIFCRFLTLNTSIYCEKSLNLNIRSRSDERFKIFFIFISIFGLFL